jgi:photosystem II stability/assembly factor-like uncharacterized protein
MAGGAIATAAAPQIAAAQAEPVRALDSVVAEELRGLSLASRARWASGAKGTIIVNGKVMRPSGAEELDFRGVQAFSARSALAMSAGRGEASQLWRTTNGGQTWTRIAVNADPAGFWDAIAFVDARRGFILGDPTEGRFTLLGTEDGGRTWARAAKNDVPDAYDGEAAFAASNGSLAIGRNGLVAFCSGGLAPYGRAYLSRDGGATFFARDTPIVASAPSRGAFACAFSETGDLWICGGDYREPAGPGVNLALWSAETGGMSAPAAPQGYLSSIAVRGKAVVATGLAGTILRLDAGPFRRLSSAPFNTIRLSGPTEAVLVGPKGTMAEATLDRPPPRSR